MEHEKRVNRKKEQKEKKIQRTMVEKTVENVLEWAPYI